MRLTRRSGVLLHPTSLPGPYGSGDLGKSAYHFVDWLRVGCQTIWQMLPLVDIGMGNSPYMSPSAFAGNVLLIDLEQLQEAGWLLPEELIPDASFNHWRINYPAVISFRMMRLRLASDRFFAHPQKVAFDSFTDFCKKHEKWLDDYALFRTLDCIYTKDDKGWQSWPQELAFRDKKALEDAGKTYSKDIHFWKFCQWCFHEQWRKLKQYANQHGIQIIGDVPIFVSLNSADVWAHPELFLLDQNGQPTVVSGVPPDKFSETGQRWGNPLYNWDAIAKNDYRWWTSRMRHMMKLYDFVRIDHFRGFEAYWEIPVDSPSAMDGKWKKGPGVAFFTALKKQLGSLSFIAEDLGIITSEVMELRRAFDFPGMRILQFAFDHDPNNFYLPHNYESDTVVYTGTHDNNTTRGWWDQASEHEKDYVRRYLSVHGDWIHWDLIRTALASIARYAIFPMQDVLGLDGSNRMNEPGLATGSWEWRFTWDQVEGWYASYLAEMTRFYGRLHTDKTLDSQEPLTKNEPSVVDVTGI